MVGAMVEPRISVTAAALVALARPAITLIDLDSPDWFTTHLPAGGYAIESGRLRLCGGPGLGLEPLAAADDPPWFASSRSRADGTASRTASRRLRSSPMSWPSLIFSTR